MTNTSNAPVTPKLAQPSTGSAAPSDPPKSQVNPEALEQLIKERVEAEVARRLAPEEDDPSKDKLRAFEDAQFANFDKKLEVFGVDVKDILPGFVLRWVNDERDRVPRMEIMGWTFVKRTEVALSEKVFPPNKDMGDNIAVYVGGDENGKPMRSFLMKITNEGFERVMRRKNAQDDLIEDSIRRGHIGPAAQQGGYAGTDNGAVKINYNPRQSR